MAGVLAAIVSDKRLGQRLVASWLDDPNLFPFERNDLLIVQSLHKEAFAIDCENAHSRLAAVVPHDIGDVAGLYSLRGSSRSPYTRCPLLETGCRLVSRWAFGGGMGKGPKDAQADESQKDDQDVYVHGRSLATIEPRRFPLVP